MKLTNNFCIDCNKQLSRLDATRCRSCARKGSNNPMYNRQHTIETKEKISITKKSRPLYQKRGQESQSYIDGRICEQQYCLDCNKPVNKINSRCSSCENKRRWKNVDYRNNLIEKRKLQVGEKAPTWQGGISFLPYPLGWNKTFKEQIRYRDGYKCRLCGCSEVENGRKLSVHHIDYNKENLTAINLISLCTKCHNSTNIKKEYWLNYFNQLIK